MSNLKYSVCTQHRHAKSESAAYTWSYRRLWCGGLQDVSHRLICHRDHDRETEERNNPDHEPSIIHTDKLLKRSELDQI